jgi:hypothetical protein
MYKPWRRQRRLTLDGLVYIALAFLWIQDPLFNSTKMLYTQNGALVNLGCPQCYMPGWNTGQKAFLESDLFFLAWFLGAVWIGAKAGVMVIRWAHSKWPRLGRVGAIAFLLIPFVFFDILTEVFWNSLGLYTWAGGAGGPSWLTLWRGHYYQLPLWEVGLAAIWYVGVAAAWFLRNDKGQLVAERGIERVRGTEKQRTGLRLLALIGMFSLIILAGYTLPMGLLGNQWSKWPADVQKRSYFTHGVCALNPGSPCPDPTLSTSTGDNSPNSGSVKLAALMVMLGVFGLGVVYIRRSDRASGTPPAPSEHVLGEYGGT